MAANTSSEVLIVGAGMAGLMAARVLAEQGCQVTVMEREPRVGGRLATRSIGPGRADSGAQFFTVRDPAFRQYVDGWLEDDLVFQWSLGWSDGSLGNTPPDGHPRYAVRGGMRALAETLARDLDVHLNTHLVAIAPLDERWQAQDQKGRIYTADALILTPPVPLALTLLQAEDVPLADEDRVILKRVSYAPCLAGLFWLTADAQLPDPGAVQRPNATITWIADNRRKGISPEAVLVTVHAGPDYSRMLWDLPDWEALIALETGLQLFKDHRTQIVERHLDRWRYAMPTVIHKAPTLRAQGLPPLTFAGDGFGSARVEGAALSGLAAAEAIRF